MLDELRFQRRLARIHSKRRAEIRRITRLSPKTGSWDHERIVKSVAQHSARIAEFEEAIKEITTAYLLEQKAKLLIHYPKLDNITAWTPSSQPGKQHIKPEHVQSLRDTIRKEQKELSELARLWMASVAGVIGALTGLIGVSIGLLVYLSKAH